MALTEEAKEARRAYQREWNARNREKRREYMERYWKRRGQKKAEETAKGGKS